MSTVFTLTISTHRCALPWVCMGLWQANHPPLSPNPILLLLNLTFKLRLYSNKSPHEIVFVNNFPRRADHPVHCFLDVSNVQSFLPPLLGFISLLSLPAICFSPIYSYCRVTKIIGIAPPPWYNTSQFLEYLLHDQLIT